MKFLYVLFTLCAEALAASRTTAPSGCKTVSKTNGNYNTIQAGVNAVVKLSGAQCLFIAPGKYNEKVTIPSTKAQITIYGSASDTNTYKTNTVTITHGLSQANGLSNEQTATLGIRAPNFKLYNVNVENTYGQGSQAVALASFTDSGFYGCQFLGFQDTVLSNEGSQVFVDCLIEGATDFIFGQKAKSWFERVHLRVLGKSLGYITGNGRDSDSNPAYYVFNGCDIAAADGEKVPNGAYYLGRPWREYARVIFQKTSMTSVVNSAGWSVWNPTDKRTGHVTFSEFGNTGPGASGKRAFVTELKSAITIDKVLGSGYGSKVWFDANYCHSG
ncbi:family 8 carbohydrate esterase [Thelonectria olida]|uniref:Pectinesterase n=1 Tax=Thelonectria olida TaxID=1576542 RepID=A0A9P8VRD4_9HYPO|nr:family 8 carbohydrate esterase [Thelonectria olida]